MNTIGRLLFCWAATMVSFILAAIIIGLLQLNTAPAPGNPTHGTILLMDAVSKAVLVAGLFPLARSLAGSARQRAAAMIAFFGLATGVNTMIEASFFTNFIDHAHPAIAVMYASEGLVLGLVLGFLFGCDQAAPGLAHHDRPGWVVRGIAAWLAFPLIYFIFGMCVAPIVTPYYRGGLPGLHIPPVLTIVEVQLVRSAIFLAASLPLIALWKGSRIALWVCLGLAHATAVGLFQMVGSTILPPLLRVTHGIEITADSFTYAAVLVLLFAAPVARAAERRTTDPEKKVEAHT